MKLSIPAIIIMILYGFVVNLANDVYLPVLPTMEKILNQDTNTIQFTYSIWFIGSTLGLLPTAILANLFNRTKVFLCSGVLFTLATYLCTVSENLTFFLSARLLQGLSVTGLAVYLLPEIKEYFPLSQQKKIIAINNVLGILSPPIGPILGVLLSSHFSWRANFYFIAVLTGILIISLFIAIIIATPQKLNSPKNNGKGFWIMTKEYLKAFIQVKGIFTCCAPGIAMGCVVAYLLLSPHIIIKQFCASEHYCIYQVAVITTYIIGLCLFTIEKFTNIIRPTYASTLLVLLGGGMLVIGRIMHIENLYFYLISVATSLLGIGYIFNLLVLEAMSKIENKTIAATLMGIIMALICAGYTTLLSVYSHDKIALLGIIYIVSAITIYRIARSGEKEII